MNAELAELDIEAQVLSGADVIGGIVERMGPGVSSALDDDPTVEARPIDLRSRALSATDLPATAGPERLSPPPSRSGRGVGRFFMTVVLLAGLGTGGWFLWLKIVRPRFFVHAAVATKPAPPPPSAAPATSDSAQAPPALPEMPKWMATIEEGQQLLSTGDADGALRKFKDATEAGAGALGRSFTDQVRIGTATTGPCKMVSFSHPRLGYGGSVGRPSIAVTPKGAVVAWTDDHEQPGHDHVYSVLLDAAGRPTSRPRDLTPEADYAMRPELLAVDDRVALLFWDKSGREPGVHVRWLDADGRINGMSTVVGAVEARPLLARARSRAGRDVLGRLGAEPRQRGRRPLPQAPGRRPQAHGRRGARDRLRGGQGQVAAGQPRRASRRLRDQPVRLSFTLEQWTSSTSWSCTCACRSRRPSLAAGGLACRARPKTSRVLGEATASNEDKVGGDYPAIACTKDACFLVWHEIDKGGAQAALIDPAKGTMLWRKRFAPRGGHPAVATTPDGAAEVAYYESGRVRLAAVSRDGVGTTSTFARVSGDEPRPWITAGRARGDWLVAWLDLESGHTESFVARLQCRN